MRLLIFIFMFLPISLFSQNKEDVLLKVNDFKCVGDTALLTMSILNSSGKTVTCYKVGLQDICTSVLKIKVKDSFGKKHEVFPCEAMIDLESIYLDCSNTVKLSPDEGFIKVVKFAVKDFAPFLIKGNYELFVEINYSIGNFESELHNVFESDLLSEKYNFKY